MKKLFLSAALAIFAVAAFAQTKTSSKSDVSVTAKSNTSKNKEKGTEVSGTAKAKSDVEVRQDDASRDGKLSAEERAARKEARKEEAKSRKADRTDNGLSNGSASENNIHGKTVSEIATETILEGSDKGAAISGVAKSNSNGELRREKASRDGGKTSEEKAARKEAGKEEAKSRKADRTDDGLLNGSASENNVHGKTVSEIATGTILEGSEKGAAISGVAKSNSNGELRRDEATRDGGKISEEKAARKEAGKEEAKSRKADRADDGLLNGSADKNIRGKAAAGVAVGTGVRGKAKGIEVSTGARTKARVGTGIDVSMGKKPRAGQ